MDMEKSRSLVGSRCTAGQPVGLVEGADATYHLFSRLCLELEQGQEGQEDKQIRIGIEQRGKRRDSIS